MIITPPTWKVIVAVMIMPFCMSLTPATSSRFAFNMQPTAAVGTYQIIQDPKMREIFTVEVMDSLRIVFEAIRQDSIEVIHPITFYSKARIPSRTEIERSDFVPLEEYEYIGN